MDDRPKIYADQSEIHKGIDAQINRALKAFSDPDKDPIIEIERLRTGLHIQVDQLMTCNDVQPFETVIATTPLFQEIKEKLENSPHQKRPPILLKPATIQWIAQILKETDPYPQYPIFVDRVVVAFLGILYEHEGTLNIETLMEKTGYSSSYISKDIQVAKRRLEQSLYRIRGNKKTGWDLLKYEEQEKPL